MGPNHFCQVQIRLFWTNFCNLDLTKTNWTGPKQLVLDQNYLDGPKSFWTHRRTRQETLILNLFCSWRYEKTPSKIGHFGKIEHILITALADQRAQLLKFMSSTEGLIIILIWGHNLPLLPRFRYSWTNVAYRPTVYKTVGNMLCYKNLYG